MPRGWLLEAHSSREGESVVLWLKEEGSGRIHRREVPWAPPFYVTGPPEALRKLGQDLAEDPRAREVRAEAIATSLLEAPGTLTPALAVVPARHGSRTALAEALDAAGSYTTFRFYDVDLSAPQTYLLERDLYPFAPVTFHGNDVGAREPPETLEYALPPLPGRELEVLLRSPSPGRRPRMDEPVRAVRLGSTLLQEGDERATLLALQEELHRQDPEILFTHGGDAFDLPQLYGRARALGLTEETFFLGREPQPFALGRPARRFTSYGRIYHTPPASRLAGRFHLDVDERFVEDVGLRGYVDVARLSRLGLQTVARQSPGTAFSAMEIARARQMGVHVPWKKNLPEREKTAGQLLAADRGGFILTPPVGVHERIDEFDFSSLFPSLMVRHNLSFETLDCPCCPESPRVAPGLGYRSCTLREGLVPRTLRPLLERRLYYKARKGETTGELRERYDELGKAWKWVLVTSFGYQGYRNARFGSIECHEAINAYARETLVELARAVRTSGGEILHGIVDSLWVRSPPGKEPAPWARELGERQGLPLSYEGRYRWIVFLPHHGHGLGVPQRYYGVYEGGEMKLRGIELRRSDACPFVKEVQREVLALLAEAPGTRAFQEAVPRALALGARHARALREGSVPPRELLLPRRAGHDLEEYAVFSETVSALRQLKRLGAPRGAGEAVRYLLQDRHARDWERRVVVEERLRGDEAYDREAYGDLLARSFETLFLPFGYTLGKVREAWGWPSPRPPKRSPPHSPERLEQRRLPGLLGGGKAARPGPGATARRTGLPDR